jgi:uracil-DNA glycosylase
MTKQEQLDQLKEQMKEDMNLPLRKNAGEMVFGEGDPDADIFFLGEGPGYHESVQGRPFVGNAGKLLDRSLQSIKLDRTSVWITNVVNFRPPENRDPLPEEIAAYTPYTDKMIEIIDPQVIVTLGRFSMAKFIPGVKISQVHGKVYKTLLQGKEVVVYPMFHPAAALRAGTF